MPASTITKRLARRSRFTNSTRVSSTPAASDQRAARLQEQREWQAAQLGQHPLGQRLPGPAPAPPW
mgnify:CR=1 FL=1